jgi:flagellar hook-length control protein FliK
MSLSTPLTLPVAAHLPAPYGAAGGDGPGDAGGFARELDQRLRDGAREAKRQARKEREDGARPSDESAEADTAARRARTLRGSGQLGGEETSPRIGKPAAFWPQGPRWPQPGGATPAPGEPGAPETGPGIPGAALAGRPDLSVDASADPDVCLPGDPDCELPVSVLPDDAPAPGSDPTGSRADKAGLGSDPGAAPEARPAALVADGKAALPPPTLANLPAEIKPGLPQPELGNWPQAWPGTRTGAGLGQAAGDGPGKGLPGDPAPGPDERFGARPTDPIRVPPGSPGSGSHAAETLGHAAGRAATTEKAKALRAAAQAGKPAPGMDPADERKAGPITAPLSTGARTAADAPGRGTAAGLALNAAALAGPETRAASTGDATTGFVAALGAAAGAGAAASANAPGSAAPVSNPAEARLATRPGDPGFGAELGTQVSLFVRGGVQTARLMLNPAEMGPVQVQIQLDGKGAQVHLAAEHPATRQALEQAMPQLAATLRESGLTLTGGGVSEQARGFGGETAPGNGSGEPGSERRSADGKAANGINAGDERLAAEAHQAGAALRTGGGRTRGVVDLVA